MNISSVIIKINPKCLERIIQDIYSLNGVEIAIIEGEIIIVTIEAKDSNEEIYFFKELEKIDGVVSINMHYCHCEDGFEKLNSGEEISKIIQILEDDNISYKGNVNTWMKQ
ncbi:chaperone NapD [Helicobacter cappadocius]|uniref:Chaperone NapD n=1 Tax=Helicobacter cappadocius TaxID=3063998 RepID=A0AA90PT91_9HELI|nr:MULTISPECIES: chaperone NapD [unclassified Helicobacter]MDO7253916.1 chaperone NapD [Helicobacter sp. faydin-H75]MDP2539787.1 chaperone NapD [Helicobacter sp. faydin-H76]